MTAMHEDVQQRAGKQQQPRKVWNRKVEMRAMLGYQEKSADQQKANQRNVGAR